jgi:hypothetical protein
MRFDSCDRQLVAASPPDDRGAGAPVFRWPHDLALPRQKVQRAMGNACAAAGIPHYHPDDLLAAR